MTEEELRQLQAELEAEKELQEQRAREISEALKESKDSKESAQRLLQQAADRLAAANAREKDLEAKEALLIAEFGNDDDDDPEGGGATNRPTTDPVKSSSSGAPITSASKTSDKNLALSYLKSKGLYGDNEGDLSITLPPPLQIPTGEVNSDGTPVVRIQGRSKLQQLFHDQDALVSALAAGQMDKVKEYLEKTTANRIPEAFQLFSEECRADAKRLQAIQNYKKHQTDSSYLGITFPKNWTGLKPVTWQIIREWKSVAVTKFDGSTQDSHKLAAQFLTELVSIIERNDLCSSGCYILVRNNLRGPLREFCEAQLASDIPFSEYYQILSESLVTYINPEALTYLLEQAKNTFPTDGYLGTIAKISNLASKIHFKKSESERQHSICHTVVSSVLYWVKRYFPSHYSNLKANYEAEERYFSAEIEALVKSGLSEKDALNEARTHWHPTGSLYKLLIHDLKDATPTMPRDHHKVEKKQGNVHAVEVDIHAVEEKPRSTKGKTVARVAAVEAQKDSLSAFDISKIAAEAAVMAVNAQNANSNELHAVGMQRDGRGRFLPQRQGQGRPAGRPSQFKGRQYVQKANINSVDVRKPWNQNKRRFFDKDKDQDMGYVKPSYNDHQLGNKNFHMPVHAMAAAKGNYSPATGDSSLKCWLCMGAHRFSVCKVYPNQKPTNTPCSKCQGKHPGNCLTPRNHPQGSGWGNRPQNRAFQTNRSKPQAGQNPHLSS